MSWILTRDHAVALPQCYHLVMRFTGLLAGKVVYMLTRFKQ